MSEDWLDTEEKSGLPAVVDLPADFASRAAIAEECWSRLTLKQKTFLQAWRECRYNARAACRQLELSEKTRPMASGLSNPDFAMVVRVWRANAAVNALDRDRLLARQDDIVETLLTPKPILHQGIMVLDTRPGARAGAVLEEVEAGAASRANETLMKAAGMLKDKDVEINVGIVVGPPTLNIQVMPLPPSQSVRDQSVVIDGKFTELPSEDWLDTEQAQ